MASVDQWTGREACALQSALRLSNAAFGRRLGVVERTVAGWHKRPEMVPTAVTQQILDTALSLASESEQLRFEQIAGTRTPTSQGEIDVEQLWSRDPGIGTALAWLDIHAGWPVGESRRRVTEQLTATGLDKIRHRVVSRSRVGQQQVANALNAFYGHHTDYGAYRATCAGRTMSTSILTRATWLDLECRLTPDTDRLTLSVDKVEQPPEVDELTATHALDRLTEALITGVRVVDLPLYRLLEIDIRRGMLNGTVGVATFAHYALTMDLLERELTDALAAGMTVQPGTVPLRDRYLPDLTSVLDVGGRLCIGGGLALCAIARPAVPDRPADYLLLVQERSLEVINAAHRLAVTPKGFHQPMTDFRGDTSITRTLVREMEEELFGRDDLDFTSGDHHAADPLHPRRLSPPMRRLSKKPGRLWMEMTGFGLNLVSGNFECANLVVIDDESFWDQFGAVTQANWETHGLRVYSSLDHELLTTVITDSAWSNEGLFAFLQGLRRLSQLAPERVDIPEIIWSIGT